MTRSGWRFECELGPNTREVYVEVSARTPQGEMSLLLGGAIRADSAEVA
jgi:hypothetical protein